MIQIVVKNEVYQQRIAHCNSCEKFTSLKICTECNCFMLIKARLPHKTCPLSLWDSATEEETVEEEIDDKYSFRRPDVDRNELVHLFGANKRFYAYNGILTQTEIDQVITVPHGVLFKDNSSIVAVDNEINVANWIELQ